MVTVLLQGGLGNQMSQFATAKALALKLDTELVIDLSFFNQYEKKSWCRPYELNIFNHKALIGNNKLLHRKYLIPIIHTIKKYDFGIWLLSVFKIYCNENYNKKIFSSLRNGTILFGFFTSERFFSQYRNEILSEFSFKHPPNHENKIIAAKIIQQNSISVHIRRGDYLNAQNFNRYFHCSIVWYEDAIQYIKNRVDQPVFYFFSDDMLWVKENFKMLKDAHFIDINHGEEAYNDMRLMSLCKHNIIANSSFSWWGAWLNVNPNKIVVAPKKYHKDNVNDIKEPFIMPESWILL